MARFRLPLPYVSPRQQRDGSFRPRFEPGPRERLAGWVSCDLKHGDGRWFTLEEASGWAIERQAAIRAQRKSGRAYILPPQPRGRTIDDLLEDFLRSDDFKRREPGTQADYRFKANALRYEGQTPAQRKAQEERTLTPFARTAVAAIGKPEVKLYFEYLARTRGTVMARTAIMVLSAAWKWGSISSKWRLTGDNPCSKIDLPKPAPRVVTWELEEVRAFVAAADRAGEHGLADAVLLALLTGQRQADVLSFTGAHVDAAENVIRLVQGKTGKRVEIPLLPALATRLEATAARRAAGAVTAAEIVVDDRTGRGFKPFTLRHRFAELRAAVAAGDEASGVAPLPSIAGKNFQDLRDTLITWLHRAGARDHERAAVSGHEISSLHQVERHYFAANGEDARAAMAKLDAWMTMKGMVV